VPRNLSSSMLAELQKAILRPVIFVEITLANETVYLWSGYGYYSWNGQSWAGVGSLGGISVIEEAGTVEAKGITLTLSGFDASLLTDVLGHFRLGLPVLVYLGCFDQSDSLIGTPTVAWAGRIDQPIVDVSATAAEISINCENRLLDMNTLVYRRYTNEDQQMDHPGDRAFEFVNSLQEVTIYWGRTPNSTNNI